MIRLVTRGSVLMLLALSSASCDSSELVGVVEARAGQFGPSRRIPELSVSNAIDTDPTFTEDRLEIYFCSSRAGNKDIWKSTRETRDAPWSAPTRLDELSSDRREENPSVSPDGLSLWYHTDVDRGLGSIWHSVRGSRDEAWGTPVPAPELSGSATASDVAAGFDESELLAVLSSRLQASGSYDLYLFARDALDVPFGQGELLSSVSSSSDDYDPFIGQQGKFLAFHSLRDGSSDIFRATRESNDEAFAAPGAVSELNTPSDESAPDFSVELDYVMFSSDRDGSDDLYEAEMYR